MRAKKNEKKTGKIGERSRDRMGKTSMENKGDEEDDRRRRVLRGLLTGGWLFYVLGSDTGMMLCAVSTLPVSDCLTA